MMIHETGIETVYEVIDRPFDLVTHRINNDLYVVFPDPIGFKMDVPASLNFVGYGTTKDRAVDAYTAEVMNRLAVNA